MSLATPTPILAPHVGSLLEQLRQRIRRYVLMRGVALVVAYFAALFWLALAIDYQLEPPRAVRISILVAGLIGGVWVAWNWLFSRMMTPLSDRSMAILIERRYGKLHESLLTAVELGTPGMEATAYHREMLAHTYDIASRETDGMRLRPLFNQVPMRKALAVASVLVGTLVGLGVFAPDALRIGVARMVGASDVPWPRATHLSIEGFKDGEAVVAKGGDLRVVVNAALDGVVPPGIEIRYYTDDGQRDRKNMVREGNAKPGVDEAQPFVHSFQGILSPIAFDVRGGDAKLRGLRIRVVESPTITSVIHCEYPSYLRQSPREIPVTAAVPIPRGSKLTLHATSNKPLVRAVVDYQLHDGTNRSAEIVPKVDSSEPGRQFDFEIERLDEDLTLLFTLHDTDGIRNREPLRVSLVAVPDTAPEVGVRLRGISSAITPHARIPLAGEIIDDYGVERAWVDFTVDEGKPIERALAKTAERQTNVAIEEVVEAESLKVKPGQKLQLLAKAADALDQPHPNVGQGDRFLLDIVTPEALRSMLEARELNLRQRFEAVMLEVTETRASLTQLDDSPPSEKSKSGDVVAPAAEPGKSTTEKAAVPKETVPKETIEKEAAAAAERVRLRVERGRQNSPKNAGETEGVAEAFEEIRVELENNRLDTEELKVRLQRQIADPLHRVAREMFPELDKRLALLFERLPEANPARASAHAAVVAQYDAILVEMEAVKSKMLELETFNEALDLLRGIIADQKRITEETKKQNKGSLLKDL